MSTSRIFNLNSHYQLHSEMEKIRGILITLLCVMFGEYQRVFGTEVKIRVKPGDNVTFFCDRAILAFQMVWIKNESNGNQSTLFITTEDLFLYIFPHFTFVRNISSNSYDLHIVNVSIYDEGIYYCAKAEKKLTQENGKLESRLEYQYGNTKTHLSVSEPVPSESPLPEVSELNCNCWTLLLSVCSVCVLFSSLLSSACAYCLCRVQTTGTEVNAEILKTNVYKLEPTEAHRCEKSKTGKFCLHSEVTYRLLTTAHPYDKI